MLMNMWSMQNYEVASESSKFSFILGSLDNERTIKKSNLYGEVWVSEGFIDCTLLLR